jgi:aspartyl-tRNA(Asn)/glutamyl-tRNA(Gln) amidotransferase subunit C
MGDKIEKEDINRFAKLARISLTESEEKELVKDARAILVYFEEISQADTAGISPMAGATDITNATGKDDIDKELIQKGIESFPESKKNCLKVPGVMKNTDE